MNKYQAAYKEIEKLFNYETIDGTPLEELANIDEHAMPIINELVDKETPVKAFITNTRHTKECFGCSSCKGISLQRMYKYCPYCGQKLDWSKDNE